MLAIAYNALKLGIIKYFYGCSTYSRDLVRLLQREPLFLIFCLLYFTKRHYTRPKFLEQIYTIIKFGLLSVILAVF